MVLKSVIRAKSIKIPGLSFMQCAVYSVQLTCGQFAIVSYKSHYCKSITKVENKVIVVLFVLKST